MRRGRPCGRLRGGRAHRRTDAGRRGPQKPGLRHRCRQLSPRAGRGAARRDAGPDPEPLRRLSRRRRPAGPQGRRHLAPEEHPGRTRLHRLHPRGFAPHAPPGLPGLRAQPVAIRPFRLPQRHAGSRLRVGHAGRAGVRDPPSEAERRDRVVAVERHDRRRHALFAGRRGGGHLPVDHLLLQRPEGRQLHGDLRREVHRHPLGGGSAASGA